MHASRRGHVVGRADSDGCGHQSVVRAREVVVVSHLDDAEIVRRPDLSVAAPATAAKMVRPGERTTRWHLCKVAGCRRVHEPCPPKVPSPVACGSRRAHEKGLTGRSRSANWPEELRLGPVKKL